MKRKLIASIVGIAASSAMVASSYGQGQISFANYSSGETGTTASPSAPITFGAGSGALTGTDCGSQINVELLYSYAGMTGGSASPIAGFDIAEDGSVSGGGVPAETQCLTIGGTPTGLFVFSGPNGSAVTIPGDPTAGPVVTFEVYAFGTVNAMPFVGESATFTQTLLSPAGDLFNNGNLTAGNFMGPMTVTTPEPTTLALGGLGMAALVAFRRRK